MSSNRTRTPAATRRRPPPRSSKRSTRWIIGGVVGVLVVAIVLAVALSSGGDDDASTAKQETAAVDVDGTSLPAFPGNGERDPAIGDAAPVVTGQDFGGAGAASIGGTGSEPSVLVFLSHSCPHCQAEVPRLVAAAGAGTFDGIAVTGIATNTSDTLPNYPPSAWLAREDWPFTVLVDDEQGTAGNVFGLTAFPYFVFLDAQGDVAGRLTGELPAAALAEITAALRAGEPLPLPGNDGGSSSVS